jgi:hypothetical protein
MKTTLTLSTANTQGIAKYSKLIGWSEAELVNHLLAESLGWWDDHKSGSLETFLGAIDYPDRPTAERALAHVAEIVRKQFDGRLPKSFRGKIRETADGRFDLSAEVIGHHGELLEVC